MVIVDPGFLRAFVIPEWSEKSFLYTVPSQFPSRQLKKVFCKGAEFDFSAQ